MPNRFSSLSRSSRIFSSKGGRTSNKEIHETKALYEPLVNNDSHTHVPPISLTPPNLKVKRVDNYFSAWSNTWKYRNTVSGVVSEGAHPGGDNGANDPWQSYCFVVVRRIPKSQEQEVGEEITSKIVIKSTYLLDGLKKAIGKISGISWAAEPLELDPYLLLAFLPCIEQYARDLHGRVRTTEEGHILASINVLLEYLRNDFRLTLAQVASLTANGEITFDLLYAILVPRTIIVTECPSTGAPHALKLISVSKTSNAYTLLCESIESTGALDEKPRNRDYLQAFSQRSRRQADGTAHRRTAERPMPAPPSQQFGKLETRVILTKFKGATPITSLDAYPLDYHPDATELKAMLIERGRKWVSLSGIHHLHYEGIAARSTRDGYAKRWVNSRVMIDRANFTKFHPHIVMPTVTMGDDVARYGAHRHVAVYTKSRPGDTDLTEDELLLTPPVLYGFSLSDKMWFKFDVDNLTPVEWNEEAFEGLVLDADKKTLIRSLVNAHSANVGFDDLIHGKGQGLVINLFGPPGVGKTLSAEATSEYVHRPLYVVGGGDLGGSAQKVDETLECVFDIATSWNAIVLIDEADVFMERRSLDHIERNAMVAVFLRHLEYYRGILFLTTNRVKAFDEAFLSRIHVGMHFGALSESAKVQMWRTFLQKAGVADVDIGDGLVQRLAARDINGRQIKNACRTAQSLAFSRGESLAYTHLEETLDSMEEFVDCFSALAMV